LSDAETDIPAAEANLRIERTIIMNDDTMRAQIKEELRKELMEELRLELLQEDAEEFDRAEEDYPWILFALDGTEYGINSKYVLSIEILGKITPIVDAKSHCPGIAKSRGEMIELLDLRALFGLGNYISAKAEGHDDQYMMIVIETDNVKRGVIVDQIVSVEYITKFIESVVSEHTGTISSQFIRQVAKREKIDSPVLIIKPESLNTL